MTEEENQPLISSSLKLSEICDDQVVAIENKTTDDEVKEDDVTVKTDKLDEGTKSATELSVNKGENIKTYVVKKQNSEKNNDSPEGITNKMILVKMNTSTVPSKSKKNKFKSKSMFIPKYMTDNLGNKSEVQEEEDSFSINKSSKMKREVKELQKSMDNSKVLSEYINDSEIRKSRRKSKFEDSESSFSRSRSVSISESQDDELKKRSNMRSHNTDFVQKNQKFLTRIQSSQDSDGIFPSDDESIDSKSTDTGKPGMIGKPIHPAPKEGSDKFCWRCHQNGPEMIPCCNCPRSFHLKCLKVKTVKIDWMCLECENVLTSLTLAKGIQNKIDSNELRALFRFALKRMMQLNGTQPFLFAVDSPEYNDYIINPMDLTILQVNIEEKKYTCPEILLNDAAWILHNTHVFFPKTQKLISTAKSIIKTCKQEIVEIETCPECYYNANTCQNWFVEVCSKPHVILWAKLKGFPFWPAKAMTTSGPLVNVRFFGEHDRAWVPIRDCYLYSEQNPNLALKTKRSTIAESIKEVDKHIEKIKLIYGSFVYPEFKTAFDPSTGDDQLKSMIPFFVEGKSVKSCIQDDLNLMPGPSSSTPKLTYKIVKTADNNMSISPIVKNTKDLNGLDEVLSETSGKFKFKNKPFSLSPNKTPDKEVVIKKITPLNRRKSAIDKTILKNNFNNVTKPIEKHQDRTYQVLRRKSTVDGEEGKLETILIKRQPDNWITQVKKIKVNAVNDGASSSKLCESTVSSSDDLITDKTNLIELKTKNCSVNVSQNLIPDSTKRKRSNEEDQSVSKKLTIESTPPESTTKKPVVISADNLKDNQEIRIEQSPDKISVNNQVTVTRTNFLKNNKDVEITVRKIPVENEKSAEKPKESPIIEIPPLIPLIPIQQIKNEESNVDTEMLSSDISSDEIASPRVLRSNKEKPQEVITIKSEPPSDEDPLILANKPSKGTVTVRNIQNMMNMNANKKNMALLDKHPIVKRLINTKSDSLPKKPIQRARKSFPTTTKMYEQKMANSPAVTITRKPQCFQNLKNTNNMVFIPIGGTALGNLSGNVNMEGNFFNMVAPKTSLPVPPLAAVSSGQLLQVIISSGPNTLSTETPTTSIRMPPLSSVTTSTVTAIGNSISSTSEPNRQLPKLIPKPSVFRSTENSFTSEAGNVSKILKDNSYKMADYFRTIIEDTIGEMSSNGNLESKVKLLELELEKNKYNYSKEIAEMKIRNDSTICEIRISLENEKNRIISETRKQCDLERIRAIEETKKKQWCACCGKEANLLCCYTAFYCDYSCQQQHWSVHASLCSQTDNRDCNTPKVGLKLVTISNQNKNSLKINKSKEAVPTIVSVNQIQRNTPRIATTSLQRLVPISGNHYTFITQRNGGREIRGEIIGNRIGNQSLPTNLIKTPTSGNSLNGGHMSEHSLTGTQMVDQMIITPESFVIGQSNSSCVSKSN